MSLSTAPAIQEHERERKRERELLPACPNKSEVGWNFGFPKKFFNKTSALEFEVEILKKARGL